MTEHFDTVSSLSAMPRRPLKVFLSYASQDKPLVRELSRRLVREGWIDTWLDVKKLLPGQDWRLKIEKAVETADIVIICLSSNSVTKEGYIQKELRYAREIALEKPEETIFLIPLRLDECEVPRGLRFYQWVDYFGENKDTSYGALVESLKLGYDQKLKLEDADRARKEILAREKEEREAAAVNLQPAQSRFQEIKTESLTAKKTINWKPHYILSLIGIGIGFVLFFLTKNSGMFVSSREKEISTATHTLTTPTTTPSHTPTSRPTMTATITPTATITLTPAPLPFEITNEAGVTMHLVSAREFEMGFPAEDALSLCQTIRTNIVWYGSPCSLEDYVREEPVHTVYLNNYYMDVFEVSNEEYKKCVLDGACMQPSSLGMGDFSNYYENEGFRNYPILNVTWDKAMTYCEWRGARLPTEAEWEKAARGADKLTHPWTTYNSAHKLYDLSFYKNRANVNLGNTGNPVPVDANSLGVSPYGLYNMAGNVAEWVADWYSETYYRELQPPVENPLGPSSGNYKVIRGGSYQYASDIRTTARDFRLPTDYNDYLGFRCAKSP